MKLTQEQIEIIKERSNVSKLLAELSNSCKAIELTQGYFTVVDYEDYDKMSKYLWNYNKGYARRWIGNGKSVLMHRELIDVPEGMFVDHVNGNKLDNRKSNLRACTNKQNSVNSRPYRRKMASQYKGVTYNKNSNKWYARIQNDGKRIFIGQYSTEKEAALAYNRKASEFFGEFAYLNVVEEADKNGEV